MFWNKKPAVDPLADLAHAVDRLRTDLDQLRAVLMDSVNEVHMLRQERALRETELADLRTRYETLIKRIGARVDRQADKASETILDRPFRHRRGF